MIRIIFDYFDLDFDCQNLFANLISRSRKVKVVTLKLQSLLPEPQSVEFFYSHLLPLTRELPININGHDDPTTDMDRARFMGSRERGTKQR